MRCHHKHKQSDVHISCEQANTYSQMTRSTLSGSKMCVCKTVSAYGNGKCSRSKQGQKCDINTKSSAVTLHTLVDISVGS